MKIIIGLAGEMASGKGTIAKYIIKKYGGVSVRFSDSLTDILKRMNLETSRENYHKISTALRNNFGEDIFSKIICHDIEKEKSKIIILDGARRPSDIKYLKSIKGFTLIFVEADLEKRLKRINARKEKYDDKKKSIKAFKKEHESEVEARIRQLKRVSDFTIDNNGNLQELYVLVDKIMEKIR